MIFQADRHYDPTLDVRDYRGLHERLRKPPPEGALWLLVAPRRGRKTWTLKAMEHLLTPAAARFVDLRDPGTPLPETPPTPGHCFLLDEPLALLQSDERAQRFLDRCVGLHRAGARLMLALTPHELSLLESADGGRRHVSPKSLIALSPVLSLKEAEAQAKRSPAARKLLKNLPPLWRRSAFLLELLFETQETHPGLDQRELLQTVLQLCDGSRIEYFRYVFHDGLTEPQREAIRRVASQRPADPTHYRPLLEIGLVTRDAETRQLHLGDPILDAHLSPLRIHHLSDIHVGPRSAESIDAKAADILANAVDSGVVRETYLTHLRGLRARGEAPHLVVVSGDLAEWATPDQLREARRWLDAVRAELRDHPLLDTGAPRILVAGGNHDVDWSKARAADGRARHHPLAEALMGYPHPRLELPPEQRKVAAISYPDFGVEFLLLGSAELGGHIDADAEARERLYLEMARLPRTPTADDRAQIEELALQAARLDPGLIHHKDLERAAAHPWQLPVRIAVLHHPVSPLPSTEVARYAGLLNAGAVKDTLFEHGFCLVLHGHVHAGWFAEERWPGRHDDRVLRIAAAPSLGSREVQEHHGFNAIDILRDRSTEGDPSYAVVVRRFVREGQSSWTESAQMGPFTPGQGGTP